MNNYNIYKRHEYYYLWYYTPYNYIRYNLKIIDNSIYKPDYKGFYDHYRTYNDARMDEDVLIFTLTFHKTVTHYNV